MRIFAGLLLLRTLASAEQPPMPAKYDPKNNISACSKHVRTSIQRARDSEWGPFDFTCVDSKVLHVYVSTGSPISRETGRFVSVNPGLFGITKSTPVIESPMIGSQMWNGERIFGNGVSSEFLVERDLGRVFYKLWFKLVDTKGWNVNLQPSPEIGIKLASVGKEALARWRDGKMRDFDGGRSDCSIRPDGCGDGVPALVCGQLLWDREEKIPPVYYGINVRTGKVCAKYEKRIDW